MKTPNKIPIGAASDDSQLKLPLTITGH